MNLKISIPTWNEEFELSDKPYSVSDVQDYFEYITWRKGWQSSIRIYINDIENRILFKINTGYYLELLMPETTKLLGTLKSKITEDKNGENVPNLEIT